MIFHRSTKYWIGPYRIKVPYKIKAIRAEDDETILSYKENITKLHLENIICEEIYKKKYAKLRRDGYYYYKTK